MTSTRTTTVRRARLRFSALVLVLVAAAAFVAACSSSKESSQTTTTEVSAEDAQKLTVGAYTFTMKPEGSATDVPFPEGTFSSVQGFDISKDGSTVMSAYSTTLPTGQTADATTVDKLLSAAGATDPQPGQVQGQPFTSATLPDGRVVILAVSGDQVAVAVGQDRDQMVNALTETAQAQPSDADAQPPQ